jgi:type I restriction enzyme R subunit
VDITKEITFEDAIEKYLTEHGGYRKGNPGEFDRNLALNKNTILAFLQETQPKEWEKLQKTHGGKLKQKLFNACIKN